MLPTNDAEGVGEKLKQLSEPRLAGEPKKSAIARAAKLAKLSYWRAWDIYYGKARQVEHYEIERIEAALDRKIRLEACNELSQLRLRLARLETLLVQTDADFHSPTTDFIGQQLRRSR
jgi:hypothetical protein